MTNLYNLIVHCLTRLTRRLPRLFIRPRTVQAREPLPAQGCPSSWSIFRRVLLTRNASEIAPEGKRRAAILRCIWLCQEAPDHDELPGQPGTPEGKGVMEPTRGVHISTSNSSIRRPARQPKSWIATHHHLGISLCPGCQARDNDTVMAFGRFTPI